jgi:Gas vesicle synthesis protein GvpO
MSEAKTLSAVARVTKARDQFRDLSGAEPVSVSSLKQVDGGWELDLDVVEVPRIPDTTSLMATYRVVTDDAGDVSGYERVRRFSRNQADAPTRSD